MKRRSGHRRHRFWKRREALDTNHGPTLKLDELNERLRPLHTQPQSTVRWMLRSRLWRLINDRPACRRTSRSISNSNPPTRPTPSASKTDSARLPAQHPSSFPHLREIEHPPSGRIDFPWFPHLPPNRPSVPLPLKDGPSPSLKFFLPRRIPPKWRPIPLLSRVNHLREDQWSFLGYLSDLESSSRWGLEAQRDS